MSNRWSLIFIHFLIIDVVFVTNYKSLCTLGCPLFVVIQKSTSQKDCVVGPLVILKTVVHNLLCSPRGSLDIARCPKIHQKSWQSKWNTLPSRVYWRQGWGSDTYIMVVESFPTHHYFFQFHAFTAKRPSFLLGLLIDRVNSNSNRWIRGKNHLKLFPRRRRILPH